MPLSQPCLTDRRCATDEPAHSRPTCQCSVQPVRGKSVWQGLSGALASSSLGPRLVLVLPRFEQIWQSAGIILLLICSKEPVRSVSTVVGAIGIAKRPVSHYVMWVLLQAFSR